MSVPSDPLDQLDYYSLLEIEPQATVDTIRAAFHAFALRYHPDRQSPDNPRAVGRAAQIFRRGAEAYRVLLNPESRRGYDIGLAKGRLRYDESADDEESSTLRTGSGAILKIRSLKARPFAKKAEMAMKNKDWKTARLNLRIALQHEPNNELLEARLATVEAALRGSAPRKPPSR